MVRRSIPAPPMRSGDGPEDAAFERLFRELHAPLCEVVHHYVRSQAVAEEIVQEVFFTLWRSGDHGTVRTVRAYLFTAARNAALDHLRREGVSRRWAERAAHGLAPDAMSQPALGADIAMERDEAALALRLAVDALPDRTRLALLLRWEQAMSHAAVAEAMGISVKGVEKLVGSAMRKLRAQLAGDGKRAESGAVRRHR